MAVESSKETGEDQVEALIDDLIRDILSDSGASSESSMRGAATTAALFETALGSGRGDSRPSMLERLLVAEVFAAELAKALAPALAEQLAPRLMKSFEQVMTDAGSRKPASGPRSTSQRRKPGARLSFPARTRIPRFVSHRGSSACPARSGGARHRSTWKPPASDHAGSDLTIRTSARRPVSSS
jgi:hypothetical protein